MKNIILAITLFAAFFSLNSFAQNSITGQVSQNDIYTNIEPDSSIQAVAVHLSELDGRIDIDVDKNGVMDFRFYASGGGGLGGGSSGCTLSSFSSENKLLTHPETSLGYPGTQYFTVNVADTLGENFELSSSCNFNNGSAVIWSNHYGASAGATVTTWNNIGDHYIGFMIKPAYDTLYGWIRISVIPGTMTLKDFACNINDYSGINLELRNNFCIYPNPANDFLNISIPENFKTNSFSICDISGKLLLEENYIEDSKEVDISDFDKGIYIIIFSSENEQFIKKFVKL